MKITGILVSISVFATIMVILGLVSFGTHHEVPKTLYQPPPLKDAITPIQIPTDLDQRKVVLGAKLFADTRLSGDGTVSCATCHDLAKAGQDGIPVARGIEGKLGQNNTPTVFNSGLNFRQFWDGRAETLEEQADGPTTNPVEMNGNWPEIIAKLQNDPAFMAEYQSIWPNELSPQHIKKAIAEYERSVVTLDAPFDKYLKGQTDALNVQALEGWKLFQKLGCISCHQGVNIGGNMYANLGILGDYFKDRGRPETLADRGRFNVTGNADDLHLFKVPSLRNVALTAPYFHDGSVPTLGDAVEIMAKYQLGVNLTAEQHAAILSFLNSLTGIFPGQVQ